MSIDTNRAATSARPRVDSAHVDQSIPSTCYWKIDFALLKEAASIRARDPREFRGAVLRSDVHLDGE